MSELPWVSAQQAVEILGVKRSTLYTYASRGWVRTRSEGGRAKLYNRADLLRLAARSSAHAGRSPRAAAALRWGEPVLSTEISAIDADGPYYRGIPALDLLHTPLHEIAATLWQTEPQPWPSVPTAPCTELLGMRRSVDALAARDSGGSELHRARSIVATLLGCAALPDHPDFSAALALTVDHGLNPSTFTARVIASTGADTYACISGALAALSGPLHGTASLQLHELLCEGESMGFSALLERAKSTGSAPGFGHPLYPAGDPRAEVLLDRVRENPRVHALLSLVDALRPLELWPNLDVGLLALCLAHDLPPSRAPLLFAAGRSVGWVAHIFEQREQPGPLRPKAGYTTW